MVTASSSREEQETFGDRLATFIGGYNPSMRRSVQTVVLYEANRVLKERYETLRPFQRKIALFDTCNDIIETIDIIPTYLKPEIMFRTVAGKVPLSPDLAWRRMKLIDREIVKTIVPLIKPFMALDKSHDEVCDEFIQNQYEATSGVQGKNHPSLWEYSHINIFLAYRMFYKGVSVNPDLPLPRAPREVVVPQQKPKDMREYANQEASRRSSVNGDDAKDVKITANPEERRAMLKEVRDHLDLLRDFAGVIPQEQLDERKKLLFRALPPVPPVSFKRRRYSKPEEGSPVPKLTAPDEMMKDSVVREAHGDEEMEVDIIKQEFVSEETATN